MTEKKRQVIVASCYERLNKLEDFNKQEVYIILAQSNFDKGVIKHALDIAYKKGKKDYLEMLKL